MNTPDNKPKEENDTGVALEFKTHPRNTILGASLLLEAMFPNLPEKEINELATYLAIEFRESRRQTLQEAIETIEKTDPNTDLDDKFWIGLDHAILILSKLQGLRGEE